jgi:hypothetical protein
MACCLHPKSRLEALIYVADFYARHIPSYRSLIALDAADARFTSRSWQRAPKRCHLPEDTVWILRKSGTDCPAGFGECCESKAKAANLEQVCIDAG